MSRELRFKPIKNVPTSDGLESFVNTIYDNFFNEIANLEDSLERENEPLHYLVTKIRLEENKKALKMFEAVVDEATEYQEIEVDQNEPSSLDLHNHRGNRNDNSNN